MSRASALNSDPANSDAAVGVANRLVETGLSRVCFGTMRMTDLAKDADGPGAAEFLTQLHELGIDSHHSSWEYDSDLHYLAALKKAAGWGYQFKHVVKLAEPSWDDLEFSPQRFQSKIRDECQRLGVEHLDVVQWLIRTKDPEDEAVCLALLERDAGLIQDTFNTMIEEGLIGAVVGFPYRPRIGQRLVAAQPGSPPLVDGLSIYLNDLEPDPADLEATALSTACPILAIRPFAGGQIPGEQRQGSFDRVVANPQVVSVIVSLSDIERAHSLMAGLANV